MTATHLRHAEQRDAAELTALSLQLGYPTTVEALSERLAVLLSHADHTVIVAERSGRVAGWIQVSLSWILESALSAEVCGFVVDEGDRRQGVGPLLLRSAEEWALSRGCRRLRVPCNVVREDAHRFYIREGFREVKRQRIFEKPLTE